MFHNHECLLQIYVAVADKNLRLLNCRNNSSCSAMIAELAQIAALPGSMIKLAICDGDSYADAEK